MSDSYVLNSVDQMLAPGPAENQILNVPISVYTPHRQAALSPPLAHYETETRLSDEGILGIPVGRGTLL